VPARRRPRSRPLRPQPHVADPVAILRRVAQVPGAQSLELSAPHTGRGSNSLKRSASGTGTSSAGTLARVPRPISLIAQAQARSSCSASRWLRRPPMQSAARCRAPGASGLRPHQAPRCDPGDSSASRIATLRASRSRRLLPGEGSSARTVTECRVAWRATLAWPLHFRRMRQRFGRARRSRLPVRVEAGTRACYGGMSSVDLHPWSATDFLSRT
jgi:hypothetical protein